tara:strand:+ start:358 stop:513 length:156 start_codon:yes stop_codon:yes gene_type:complete
MVYSPIWAEGYYSSKMNNADDYSPAPIKRQLGRKAEKHASGKNLKAARHPL